MNTVGVVGAGIMGAGIAQRCATYLYPVILEDSQPAQLQIAKTRIEESLDKLIKKLYLLLMLSVDYWRLFAFLL